MVVGGREVPEFEDSGHAREFVSNLAFRELGKDDPTPYWEECGVPRPFPLHWCGAFALWCLRIARLCNWEWEIGRGFLYRLRTTTHPQQGDIAYFSRAQHHAIYDGHGQLYNGNGAGGKVTLTELRRPLAWYSIGKLVSHYDLDDYNE